MSFILTALYYSLFGALTGFLAHLFNGFVRSEIQFNKVFVKKTIIEFFQVLITMALTTVVISSLVNLTPINIDTFLIQDKVFREQIYYYLMAFAAFDFGIQINKIK
jgi:hypothetical protein